MKSIALLGRYGNITHQISNVGVSGYKGKISSIHGSLITVTDLGVIGGRYVNIVGMDDLLAFRSNVYRYVGEVG